MSDMAAVTPEPSSSETADFAARLEELRESTRVARGLTKLSWDHLHDLLLQSKTKVNVSGQRLADIHSGKVHPAKVRIEWLLGLCEVYECAPTELGPIAAAMLAQYHARSSAIMSRKPRGRRAASVQGKARGRCSALDPAQASVAA